MKRGVSDVVATVLIVMITVVAATLLAVFLIPFVQENLDEGKDCFEVLGSVSLSDTGYTCLASQGSVQRTGFSIAINDDRAKGFKVLVISEGSSSPIEVSASNNVSDKLKMLGGSSFGEELSLPENGGVRTYVYDGSSDKIEIYPIMADGEICSKSDEVQVTDCSDASIISKILS